ncbi:MAG: lauroyl/myristoyl acyltransferase [Candidatus Sumerlaeia bacterium]
MPGLLALKAAVGLIRVLPMRVALGLAAGLGWLIGALCPIRGRTFRRNLDLAFGDSLSRAERGRLIRAAHSHWFRMAVEFFQLPRIRRRFDRFVVDVEGEDIVKANCSAGGRGAIIVSGHLGNWELMPVYGSVRYNLPMTAVAKPLHNRRIDKWVVELRQSVGVKILSSREGGRGLRDALRRGETVGFVADQNAGRRGELLTFFNHPASTYIGPALMALLMNVPLIPAFAVRCGFQRYRLIFHPPLQPPQNAASAKEAARDMMQQFNNLLEDLIRRHPEQYFWFHNRWKRRPEDSACARRPGRSLTSPPADTGRNREHHET